MSSKIRAISCALRNPVKLVQAKHCSSDATFVPPKRIPRSPTDVLRALANTVGKDPTAPHYKYHDDPYLIPYSNLQKRAYGLSQESGRKAAQWIRQEHSELFQHKEAEPFIQKFAPKAVYNEETNVNEEILNNVIQSCCVADATTIYELLVKKGEEISLSTKQSLLELLCYYNGQEPLNEDWIEERWYRQNKKLNEILKNTWKGHPLIDDLFKELSQTDHKSSAYCALICGMLKHGQVDQGWSLYEKTKEEKIDLNLETYNMILSKTPALKQNYVVIMELAQSLVMEMNSRGIKPNLHTLNTLLKIQSSAGLNKFSNNTALKTFAEFKRLEIEPSAASYYHLINILSKNAQVLRGVMLDILDRLKGKRLEPQDEDDTLFFVRAMELAAYVLKDKDIAYNINDLLHFQDNYNLIGDSFRENTYYRHFFTLLSGSEPFEVLLEIYDRLVPNVYVPEYSVMMNILEAQRAQMAYEHLPRMWSDITMFELLERNMIPEKVLEIAVECVDENLKQSMAEVGWLVYKKVEDAPIRNNKKSIEWTGTMLGNLLTILLRNEELSKAHLVFDNLSRNQNELIGEPKIESLQLYLDSCISNESADSAIKCIKYCNEMGFIETSSFAKKLRRKNILTTSQKERLDAIVGAESLNKENE